MANKNKIINQAQKYIGKGQWDKAIKELNKLIAEDPSDVRTLLKLGDVYSKKGDRAQATATYKQVAESYSGQGFFLKAVAVYKQILKHDPNQLAVVLKLAELYEHLGLAQEAMGQYQRASQIHDEQGDARASLDVLRRMVDLDQDNVASRIKLAESFSREGSVDEAVREFERAAAILQDQGRIEDYIKVAERLVYHAPERSDVIKQLARHYLDHGETKRGLAKLQLCFKSDPRDIETLELLAAAFKALGQSQKTVFVYRELASVYQDKQDIGNAERAHRAILEIDPHDAEARAALGMSGAGVAADPSPQVAFPDAISASIDLELLPPEEEDGGFVVDDAEALTVMPTAGEDFDPLAGDFAPPEDPPPPRPPSLAPPPRAPSLAPPPRAPTLAPPPQAPVLAPPPQQAPILNLDADQLAPPPASNASEQVARLLTETDVFIKYGLADKALEHLRAVFALDPDYVPAYEKMRDIYIAQGDNGRAGEAMAHILHVHARQGDTDALEHARAQLAAIAPGHPLAAGGLPGAIPAPPITPAEDSEEISIDIDEDSFEMLGDDDIGEVRALGEAENLGQVLTDNYDEAAFPSFGEAEEATVAAHGYEGEAARPAPSDLDDVAQQAAEMAANMGWEQTGHDGGALLQDEGLVIATGESISVELPDYPRMPTGSLSADLAAPPESLSLDIMESSQVDLRPELYDAPAVPESASVSGADLALDLDEPAVGMPLMHNEAFAQDELPPIDLGAPVSAPDLGFDEDPSIESPAERRQTSGAFEQLIEPAEVLLEEVPPETALGPEVLEEPTTQAEGTVDIDDDLEELDFFIQAELFDEAQEALQALTERAPGDPRLAARSSLLDSIQAAEEPDEHPSTVEEPPPELMLDEAMTDPAPRALADEPLGEPIATADATDETTMPAALEAESIPEAPSELAHAPLDSTPPTQAAPMPGMAPVPDFASEDLSSLGESPAPVSAESAEDAYDQAMMFRELGMLDEAIAGFEQASASPNRALTCREMIGLCHLERGEPLVAVTHLESALQLGPEDRAATNLKYEIGAAYEAAGDDPKALHWFEACASDDASFREVGARIADVAQRLSDGGPAAAPSKKSKISYL